MTDARLFRQTVYGAAFLGLAALVMLVKLLPLNPQGSGLPAPDLVLALIVAWMLRRPDLLPLGLIVAVGLLGDLLLMRPPGLWTAITVVATEALRRRYKRLRTVSVTGEIGLFAALMTGMIGVNWLVLSLTFTDQPGLGAQLLRMPVTVMVYPLAMLVCAGPLGLRRLATTDSRDAGRWRPL